MRICLSTCSLEIEKAVILAQHNDKQDLALPCACTATGGLSLVEPQLKLVLTV